jgi:chemotaxis protein CheZ
METVGDAQPGQSTSAADLASRLEKITDQLQKEIGRLASLDPISPAEKQLSVLHEELDGIAHLIAETRTEIAGLQPSGLAYSHLTGASDELDAVVGATERAAVEIMVAAERAQEAAQRLRNLADLAPQALRDLDEIESASLDIFMACSFQDLTGQRIRKVVNALAYIEKRVTTLTGLWQAVPGQEAGTPPRLDHRDDSHLLNGPNDAGLQQDDIDMLLHGHAAPTVVGQDDVDALFADVAKSVR